MTTLSPEDISHLATLARLVLTEEEQARYAAQLTSVVGYVEQLEAVPTEAGVSNGVTGLENVLAEDTPRTADDLATLNPETALAAAPLRDGKFIQVRAVLNQEAS